MKSYPDEASLTSLPQQVKQSRSVALATARKANPDLSLQRAYSVKRNYMVT